MFLVSFHYSLEITDDTQWKHEARCFAGGGGKGTELNRLNNPYGIDIDDDGTVFVSDLANNRIMSFKSGEENGRVITVRKGSGPQCDQLNRPSAIVLDRTTNSLLIADWGNSRVLRWSLETDGHGHILVSNIHCDGLAIDNAQNIYVSDHEKHEVRRYRSDGTQGEVVAGGNERGNGLNQLNVPGFLFIDDKQSLYISDTKNNRVMKWEKNAKEGVIVVNGQSSGNKTMQIKEPRGLFVNSVGSVYVVDQLNNRLMRWCKDANEGTVIIDGKIEGSDTNQLKNPMDLSFDRDGNLYITDLNNDRIQRFDIKENVS